MMVKGFRFFPDNTILTKTFYYYADERDPSLGKTIIETRVLIKKEGVWNIGNYVWNQAQTDAALDEGSHNLVINWIDEFGVEKVCRLCHTYLFKLCYMPSKQRCQDSYRTSNEKPSWHL